MRKLWMLLVAVALSAALPAQTGDADLLVLESSGKVKYFAPDGSMMRLESGMKIDPEGSLKLCPKAKVQVLQGIEVTTFDEKGRHSLTAELPEEPATSRFGFGGEFLALVSQTMENTDDPPPPPPTSTKKGMGGASDDPPPPPPTSTKKGMGGGETSSYSFPVKGNIVAGTTLFSWASLPQATAYDLQIKPAGSDEPVFTAAPAEHFVEIDLSGKAFKPGTKYIWTASGGNGITLGQNEFTLVTEADAAKVLQEMEVTSEPEYQAAGEVRQWLWEAYAYEQAGYFYKAWKLYGKAWETDNGNDLIYRMYSAFLFRVW